MGAPKGNSFAKGNSGGRRPTEKEEKEHARQWWAEHDVEELERKVASKKYSPWDAYRLRALKADQTILKNWADKVLATLVDHTTNGKDISLEAGNSPALEVIAAEYEEKLKKALQGQVQYEIDASSSTKLPDQDPSTSSSASIA